MSAKGIKFVCHTPDAIIIGNGTAVKVAAVVGVK